MSNFKQLQVLKVPKIGKATNEENLYWKDFDFPTIINEYGGINNISISETKPHYVAVTNTSRVNIYDSEKLTSIKNFSFSENAYSANFRSDGRLLCVGFDKNNVKVYPFLENDNFDLSLETEESVSTNPKKRPLRKFDDHNGPVHVCHFMRNLYNLFSASDDMHVRLFDLATSATIMKIKCHKDYIRCGAISKTSDDLILTGSYDHYLKLIDIRTQSVVLSVDHGEPVENCLMFPSANMFISCGGNSIKIWDVLQGGKLVRTLINHHKTVTSMSFSKNCRYLLSGGLDRHVKVFDLLTYDSICTYDYPSPVLSLGLMPDDKGVYVGMTDGLLSIKTRKNPEKKEEEVRLKKKTKAFNPYRYATPTFSDTSNDHIIQHTTKQHLEKFDKNLKKFNVTKALDSVLETHLRTKSPQITIGVMQELIRRGSIKAALSGRDEKSLSSIIKFIQRNISNPNFTATLTDIANILLGMLFL